MTTSETRWQEHERLIELLGAYVGGELSPQHVDLVQAHVLGCRRCQKELALQRAVRSRLQYQHMERAPAALREHIKARLANDDAQAEQQHSPRRHRWWRVLPWAGWALAACLALVVGLQSTLLASQQPRPIPMIAAAVADYHSQLASELSADTPVALHQLKQSLPFPITPIVALRSHMIAAWSLHIHGAPAAALAYRFGNQVIVQYVVSESVFFRQPTVRQAVAAYGQYVVSLGADSVVAWPGSDNGSLLVGSVPVQRLQFLHSQENVL